MPRPSPARWLGAVLLAAGLVLVPTAPAAPATPGTGPGAPSGTEAALTAGKAALDRAAGSRPPTVTGWHVDPAAASLVVSVHGSAKGVAEWAATHGAARVAVEYVEEAPRPTWNLISGQRMTSAENVPCTLGFNARNSTGTRYVLAAGHCVSLGTTWYGAGGLIGTSAGSSFPTNDYGRILVTSALAMSTALVDRYSAGPDVTISGVGSPAVGTGVCYSSPTTGWRCGTITALNGTVCYPQGCVTGLVRTTLCSAPGASGAPVVTNPGAGTTVRALGLVSGGSGNCTTGGTTWFQLIAEPLLAYGLTLYTG